jgi:general secretion pathway protein G
MINTFHRLKRQGDAGEIDGFTLIEILIVIVVLGILAAVVIFALGGIAGKSAVAACQADGATVSTALATFKAQNVGTTATQTLLTTGTAANGNNPYIQSWPSSSTHFAFAIATAVGTPTGATAIGQFDVSISPAGAVTGSGTFIPYAGPASCIGVS